MGFGFKDSSSKGDVKEQVVPLVESKVDLSKDLTPSKSTRTTSPNLEAKLGQSSRVVGELTFEGEVEINGEVEGSIEVIGTLRIGETAVIKGTIRADRIMVRGMVQGDIFAEEKLVLQKPAQVEGDLKSGSLSIEEGVLFVGRSEMIPTKENQRERNSGAGNSPDGKVKNRAGKNSTDIAI